MNKPRMDMDLMQLCLARNITILPHVYSDFLTNLKEMEYKNKISLIPITIFQVFHQKYQKTG